MDTLETLNDRFAIPFKLRFKSFGDGLIAADITNAHASASLCLQGGHLLSWQPVSTPEPVIWMSPAATCAPGHPIRGGIPVCWPWFGAHESQSSFPAHGFARTQPWQVTGTRSLEDGSTEIALSLLPADDTQAFWPHPSRLDLLLNVGTSLKIALITRNRGESDFVIREALHTYFHVSDIARVHVLGLEDGAYMDKAAGWTPGQQVGALGFSGEVDRVYTDTPAACVIEDAGFGRRIRIAKLGSQSTVVWNPWQARAAQMGDLGADGWKGFVCVESGNALENAVTVAAGTSHMLAVEYRVESA
ncbi:MAG: D-hexose-6-phosphate mutarotase [Burkholderiaceae bacterium]|nr:D-hexose-6-phosphate mutarotase [Burkholderiaceae bacterium]